ncbi:MAG: ChbG/HpnK family deacetylase [Desulfuromonadaceae bacterium]
MPQSCALIVNADDLGWAPGRDRGILRTIDQGIVSSVSLLANGATFAAAATLIQEHDVGVGVHLNLSEGKALSGYINGLTDRGGDFLGKRRARAMFAHGSFDPEAALRELKAQVEAVLGEGLIPDHVDYHQHMGIFPSTLGLIIEVCRSYGIRAARLSCPVELQGDDPDGALGAELRLYRRFGSPMRAELRRAGLFSPAGIWGMPLLNHLDSATLMALLKQIPPGCWELMVHPGDEDPGIPFCGLERRREQEALTCTAVREIIRTRNIRLITFGDLHAYSYLLP